MLPAFIKEWSVSSSAGKCQAIRIRCYTPLEGRTAVLGDVLGERTAGSLRGRSSRRRGTLLARPRRVGRPGVRGGRVREGWWCRS